MKHHTLAEIAAKFARIDGVDDENHAQFEKNLRNLVQRHFLPQTTQQGRIFLYDASAALTIRFAQIAADFGLPRATIDNMSRWLSNAGERRREVEGGSMGVSRAEEAIQRVEAKENFGIHIAMRADHTFFVTTDWVDENAPKPNSRVRNATLNAGLINTSPEIARFSLPASKLIAEILPLLKD